MTGISDKNCYRYHRNSVVCSSHNLRQMAHIFRCFTYSWHWNFWRKYSFCIFCANCMCIHYGNFCDKIVFLVFTSFDAYDKIISVGVLYTQLSIVRCLTPRSPSSVDIQGGVEHRVWVSLRDVALSGLRNIATERSVTSQAFDQNKMKKIHKDSLPLR